MTNNELVFWVGHTINPFTAITVEQHGAGGAERALCEIAARLAGKYKVTVYVSGLRENNVEHQGVTWKSPGPHCVTHKDHTLIVWRNPATPPGTEEMLIKHARKKILWLHDPNLGPFVSCKWQEERQYDVAVCVSEWHKHSFLSRHDFPESRVTVIPNGIRTEDFEAIPNLPRSRENRVVYASSPMRGLSLLLDEWPYIHKQISDASLHIYYGFEDWKKYRDGKEATELEARLESLVGTSGINYHGRVSPTKMVQEFYKGKILAYPSTYPETYCLTAVEAQAAGCVPVTSMLGNLPYVIHAGEMVDGLPDRFTSWKRAFAETVVDLIRDEKKLDSMASRGRAAAMQHDWGRSAQAWLNLISSE